MSRELADLVRKSCVARTARANISHNKQLSILRGRRTSLEHRIIHEMKRDVISGVKRQTNGKVVINPPYVRIGFEKHCGVEIVRKKFTELVRLDREISKKEKKKQKEVKRISQIADRIIHNVLLHGRNEKIVSEIIKFELPVKNELTSESSK